MLEVANSPEFRGLSPKQIVPRLADEGIYVASESTFHRLLRREARQKRAAGRSPTPRVKPTHQATGPNQLWSWDITYLKSSLRGQFFYLYIVVDVWSRKIVGWAVHRQESAKQAAKLISKICQDSGVDPKGLVLHSDNGGPMRGATMLTTLQWLGIVPSFSRPHVSDDNPYSEALFRTVKSRPSYPKRPFVNLQLARAWVGHFVCWYNTEHRHSGIRYVTPEQRHSGQDGAILARRKRVYECAKRRRPTRWTGQTRNCTPVHAVFINPPAPVVETDAA